MALFLLAYACADAALPAGIEERIRDIVAAGGTPVSLRAARVAAACVDLGLWPTPGVSATPTSFVAVAGDPVLCQDGRGVGRAASVETLSQALGGHDLDLLPHCHGSYSALAVDATEGSAIVLVDKLAVRPVYVARHQGVIYAASAMWMLERLADLPKRCDWRGITEVAAFGYALADRTSYLDIEALAPGTALVCTSGESRTHRYWDWRDPASAPAAPGGTDHVARIEAAFHQAVDDRIVAGTEALAFLSGGMDSRYIAARLRQQGVALNTLNFAPEGSADLAFGRLAAQAMGTRHLEFGAGDAPFAQRKSEAIATWRQQRAAAGSEEAARLRVLWSGDGGSVVMGHVYLNDEIVATARTQGADATARVIQRHNKYQVSPRMFTGRWRELADVPLQGIRQELARCAAWEPGRAAHLFFVLNDQRRHLVSHYEHVHELGFDLHLPFFDARLMQAVFACPVEQLVGHRLYNRLFERLPFGLGQVPWQAYPGHEPCPVAIDTSLRRQWSDGWFDADTERKKRVAAASAMRLQLRSPAFPLEVLSRLDLTVALQLTQWGLKDYSYLVSSAAPFLSASQIERGLS